MGCSKPDFRTPTEEAVEEKSKTKEKKRTFVGVLNRLLALRSLTPRVRKFSVLLFFSSKCSCRIGW